MDDIKKQLGYKPDIKYTENYYSTTSTDNNSNDVSLFTPIVDELYNVVNQIDNSLNGLPNNLSNAIQEIYDPIKDLYNNYLKDKIINKVPAYIEPKIIIPEPEKNPEDDPGKKPDDEPEDDPNKKPDDEPEDNPSDISPYIRLDKSLIYLHVNSSKQLIYTILPENSKYNLVQWISSDTNIAIVDDGLVTGLKEGTCNITVNLLNTNRKAICKVIVLPENSPSNPDISPIDPNDDKNGVFIRLNKSLILLKEKTLRQLYYTIIPSNSKYQNVEWISSDENIATVNNGLVTGIKKGKTQVTVNLLETNKKAVCRVIVLSEDSPINVDPSDIDPNDKDILINRIELSRSYIEIFVNEEYQLDVSIYPSNATNKNVFWESSDEEIAIVNEGLVKGIQIGQCKITVTSVQGNKKDYCYVTVKNKKDDDKDPDDKEPEPKEPDDGSDEDLWNTENIPTVIFNENDPREIVEKEFIKNIYDLINYYLMNLNDEMNKYYFQILKLSADLNDNDLKTLFNDISTSNSIINTQLQHLFDTSLKTLRVSNVKLNYLENCFNVNQTTLHIQSFLATYEQRKKYINIKFLDPTDKEASESNHILKSLNIDYDIKYDDSYKDLFRYVNSSLKVTSDVLNDIIQGLKSKELLILKGGIK